MGILDAVLNQWGQWSQDPNQNRANDAYLNALAAGLLSGRSNNFGVNLGRAMGGAQGAMGEEQDRIAKQGYMQAQVGHLGNQDSLIKQQIADAQRKSALQEQMMRQRQSILGDNGFDFKQASQMANAGMPVSAPSSGLTLDKLNALHRAGLATEDDFKALKANEPVERKPGSAYLDPRTNSLQFIDDPKAGTRYDGKSISEIPGAIGVEAAKAGAIAGATERAKAPFDMKVLPGVGPGGAPVYMSGAEWAGRQGLSGQLPPPVANGELQQFAMNEAMKLGIDPRIAMNLFKAESNWNPSAVSPKGAIGVGQLMPGTARELGVDPTDPRQNIMGSLRYLRQQLDAFGGDYTKALAAYNAGPGAVQKAGGVPNFPETQNYVAKVQGGAPSVGITGQNPVNIRAQEAAAKDNLEALRSATDRANASVNSGRQIADMKSVIAEAEKSGRTLAGPTTAWRDYGLSLANTFGLTGKGAEEWMAQRTQLINGAAALALQGAEKAKGQGQITENERKLIAEASSANIDRMTMPQIKAALDAIDKVNQWNIQSHKTLLERTPRGQLGDNLAIYQVDAPPRTEAPKATAAPSMRDLALEELRRRNRGSTGSF